MGQTPAWLDFELAPQYNVSILFHTELYGDKKSQLPIFNALALESQFFNVPSTSPDDDVMVYFNDDMFLASEHSVSDFWNPLLGVNIEFEPENWIMNEQSSLEGFQEDWGETTTLRYSNFLLSTFIYLTIFIVRPAFRMEATADVRSLWQGVITKHIP